MMGWIKREKVGHAHLLDVFYSYARVSVTTNSLKLKNYVSHDTH